MDAMEILARCRSGAQELEAIQRSMDRLQMCGLDGVDVQSAADRYRMAMDSCARALDADRIAACKLIDTLPDPVCGIMYRYYVLCQCQGAIMSALHISASTYKRQKRRGIELVRRIAAEEADEGR